MTMITDALDIRPRSIRSVNLKKVLLTAGLLFLLNPRLPAAEIRGSVLGGDNQPVDAASVALPELQRGVFTDKNGQFILEDLPAGSYRLEIRHVAFETFYQTLTLHADDSSVEFRCLLNMALHRFDKVTVSAVGRHANDLNGYRSVHILDRNEIESSSNGALADILRNSPSVQVLKQGPGIEKPVIRGLTNSRILIMDRGVRLEGQQWSHHHTPETDAGSADRIELIRGPASLLYGADALGGVIQIHRLSPFSNGPGPASQTALRSGFESNGSALNASASYKTVKGHKALDLDMSAYHSSNYSVPGDHNFLETQEFTGFSKGNLAASLWHEGHRYLKNLSLSYYSEEQLLLGEGHWHNTGGGPDGTEPWFHPAGAVRSPTEHLTLQTELLSQNSPHGSIQHISAVQQNRRRGIPSGIPVQIDILTRSLSHSSRFTGGSEKLPFSTGIQLLYKDSDSRGPEKLIPTHSRFNAGLFSLLQKINPADKYSAGIRLDLNREQVRETVFSAEYTVPDTLVSSKPVLSGGIGWVHHRPGSPWAMVLNIGSAFRNPNAAERFIRGIHHAAWKYEFGEPRLRTEQMLGTELILRTKYGSSRAELSLYSNHFRDYVYSSPSGTYHSLTGIPIYLIRQGPARMQGFEFSFSTLLPGAAEALLSWSSVRGTLSGISSDSDEDGRVETYMPEIPPDRIQLQLTRQFPLSNKDPLFSSGVSLQHFFAQNRLAEFENILPNDADLDGSYDALPPSAYSLLNAWLTLHFSLQNHPQTLSLNLKNLTNTKYYSHLSQYKGLAYDPGFSASLIWSAQF